MEALGDEWRSTHHSGLSHSNKLRNEEKGERLQREESRDEKYELALLPCLLLLAKLVGQTTFSGATEWIRHRADTIAERSGLARTQMPCQMTYCRILARVDAQLLDELLAAFFIRWEAKPRCGSEPSRCRDL